MSAAGAEELLGDVVRRITAASAIPTSAASCSACGAWRAIAASHRAAGTPPRGAPVAGRTCETGLSAIPTVTENIVAYDDGNRTLTSAATGLPRFIGEARNRWQVTNAGPGRASARFDGVLETRGLRGLLAALPLRIRMRRETRRVLDDLKHYAEHGTPSPREQRQLAARGAIAHGELRRRSPVEAAE